MSILVNNEVSGLLDQVLGSRGLSNAIGELPQETRQAVASKAADLAAQCSHQTGSLGAVLAAAHAELERVDVANVGWAINQIAALSDVLSWIAEEARRPMKEALS
jgi:hypothetical protein